jgi:drug/metabolite transporter (DMT)-like permease
MLAVWSMVTTLPGALLEALDGEFLRADAMTAGTLIYSSVFSSSLAYVAWGRGIDLLGVTRAGAFLHLVPLFGALLATTFLGETLGLHHLVGFALILLGVSLAVNPKKRRRGKKKNKLAAQRRP